MSRWDIRGDRPRGSRGGNRGKHSLGSTETLAVSRKGSTYTIAQKGVTGRFIQIDKEDLFDLADILDEVCAEIENRESQ